MEPIFPISKPMAVAALRRLATAIEADEAIHIKSMVHHDWGSLGKASFQIEWTFPEEKK